MEAVPSITCSQACWEREGSVPGKARSGYFKGREDRQLIDSESVKC